MESQVERLIRQRRHLGYMRRVYPVYWGRRDREGDHMDAVPYMSGWLSPRSTMKSRAESVALKAEIAAHRKTRYENAGLREELAELKQSHRSLVVKGGLAALSAEADIKRLGSELTRVRELATARGRRDDASNRARRAVEDDHRICQALLDEARATNSKLHRRTQAAEAVKVWIEGGLKAQATWVSHAIVNTRHLAIANGWISLLARARAALLSLITMTDPGGTTTRACEVIKLVDDIDKKMKP